VAETLQTIFHVLTCIAGTAFFASFVLTFGSGKFYSTGAAIFYSVGMMVSMTPFAYFHFSQGSNWTFGRFPTLEWLLPVLLFCFGAAAVVLLSPAIQQKTAMRLGMILFFVICPILIVLRLLPQFLQFHHRVSFDLTWLVYAVLWFRVREGHPKIRKPKPAKVPQAS
jgi:hypothetical protein